MKEKSISPFVSNPWNQAAIFFCGGWLLISSFVLRVEPGMLAISDRVNGALLLALAGIGLRPKSVLIQWLEGSIGAWLLAAPLIFWTPHLAAYVNDTLAGTAVLAFALVIPYSRPTGGPGLPPGWSYNPSQWAQRVPIVLIGVAAFAIAAYMASFQLGHRETVWDPIFGEGTRRVLLSDVSKAFPVSDAGLGAYTYLLEALFGLMGDPRRWRTMPWVVLLFGFLVVPAGVVSIVLVVLQPWAVGAWCTLCLVSALLCLATLPPAMDEAVASIQFLKRTRQQGHSVWRALFQGEVRKGPPESEAHPSNAWFDLQVPWNLCGAALAGLWLMFTPAVLKLNGILAHLEVLTGALILTFAVMAMAEVGRILRRVNVVLGAWTIVLPWLAGSPPASAAWIHTAVGLGVIALSFRRGPIHEQYGAWNAWIR